MAPAVVAALAALCAACPDLEQREATSDAEVSAIAAEGRVLERLVLWGPGISDEGIRKAARLRGLESLILRDCRPGWSAGLEALESATGLRELTLWQCPGIDAASLERVARIPRLRVLSLHELELRDGDLAGLAAAPELRTLVVPQAAWLGPSSLADLACMRRLELLDLRGCENLGALAIADLKRALPGCKVLREP